MGEILGVGLSHFPGFIYGDEHMAMRIKKTLTSPKVPDEYKDPAQWPEQMRREWGDDEGLSFAREHRAGFVEGLRRIREAIDRFEPDAVVVFGDDQYENFREDLIPPFAIYVRDQYETQPFLKGRGDGVTENIWGLPRDEVVTTPGSTRVARYLATALLEEGFDLPVSFAAHHLDGLGHAFMNTVLYLDYERSGWPYPLVPFHVNAYGSSVVRSRGSTAHLFSEDDGDDEADPPAPSSARCFELGRAVARIILDSPHRVVVVGSASWSHAFLTRKHHYVYPDVEADRVRYTELMAGDTGHWPDIPLSELEENGQHELLNWMPLVGAMYEVGLEPEYGQFLESYLMNSSKVTALYPVAGRP